VFPASTSCVTTEGWGSEEDEEKHEPEPVSYSAEAHAAFTTVKLFFYKNNIGKCDENIMNMERALSGLKRMVSTKQLSIKVFFFGGGGGGGKQVSCTQILKRIFCLLLL
jgi:hypothetical protein